MSAFNVDQYGAVRSASNVYGGGSRKRQGSVQMVEVRYECRTPYLKTCFVSSLIPRCS